MNKHLHIQALLEKYWESETSIEEERELKQYFQSGDIAEGLRQFAPLFQAFREEQAVQMTKTRAVDLKPILFGWSRIAAAASVALVLAAGAWWMRSTPQPGPTLTETPVPVVTPADSTSKDLQPEQPVVAQSEEPESKPQMVRKTPHLAKRIQKVHPVDPEAEKAMEEIKAALALVSSKIKKGRTEAAKGASHLEEVDRIFKRKEG